MECGTLSLGFVSTGRIVGVSGASVMSCAWSSPLGKEVIGRNDGLVIGRKVLDVDLDRGRVLYPSPSGILFLRAKVTGASVGKSVSGCVAASRSFASSGD